MIFFSVKEIGNLIFFFITIHRRHGWIETQQFFKVSKTHFLYLVDGFYIVLAGHSECISSFLNRIDTSCWFLFHIIFHRNTYIGTTNRYYHKSNDQNGIQRCCTENPCCTGTCCSRTTRSGTGSTTSSHGNVVRCCIGDTLGNLPGCLGQVTCCHETKLIEMFLTVRWLCLFDEKKSR